MWYLIILLHPLILLAFVGLAVTQGVGTGALFIYLLATMLYGLAVNKHRIRVAATSPSGIDTVALSAILSFGILSLLLTPYYVFFAANRP